MNEVLHFRNENAILKYELVKSHDCDAVKM